MPLEIQLRAASPLDLTADVFVVGVLQGGKTQALSPSLHALDGALGGALSKQAAKEEFTGKRDQMLALPTLGRVPAEKIILIGLGERRSLGAGEVRTFAAKAARAANGEKAASLALVVPAGLEGELRAVGEGLELGAYRFTKYLTGERKPKAALASVVVATAGKTRPTAKSQLATGQKIGVAVNLSRDLSNEPSNVIYPETFAHAAEAVAKEHGLKIQVFDFKEIRRRGMKLIDAVGRGSSHEPRFVHMAWAPKGAKKKLVFIGKGITFDSGGLSIKPAAGMGEMKHDMSGAANVVGLMVSLAALKPKCEVHAIFAAVENMPDGNAYRPGDVWSSLDGKSVEIINTDAEGRLILADALAYARDLKPDLLVDNATLTGAMVVALGNTCTGWFANSEAAAREFEAAVKHSGESMWRMPLLDELKEGLKSDVADLKHTGDRWGGAITAALFLREFIGDTKNWVHADIAGPAMSDRAAGWWTKGGTGHAVLTFVSLVERASGK
jgi:leucyl aminopeptidase